MKRLISLVMAVTMLLGCISCVVYAEAEIVPYNSSYFISYGTTLSKEGDGRIKIIFQACATGVASSVGVATYEVDKLDSDGNWEDCTGLRTGETGTNVGSYTYSIYFNGKPGETYRVKVTFICDMDGGYETKTYTSGRITAK